MRTALSLLANVYGDLPRTTWLCCAAAFVNRAGSMVVPFLSLYLGHRFGYTVGEAGVVVSVYGLGSFAGNLLGGRLCDRLGPVRVQITMLLAAAAWMAVLSTVGDARLLCAGVFVLGVLNDAFRPGNMAAVIASAPPLHRGKALALNRLAVNAGWAIGPTIGGQLAAIDFRWLFLADGATCALAALVLWTFVPRTLGRSEGVVTPADALAAAVSGSPWRDRRFLALLCCSILWLLAFMQYVSTETRHLERVFGLDESDIGWLLAINPVLITCVEMPLAHALRRRAQLPLVALGGVVLALSFPLLVPVGWGMAGVLASLLLLTVGEMFYSPFLGAFVGERAPVSARGAWLGAYGASFALAWMVAPGLGGLVYDELGADALWYGCSGAALLSAAGFAMLHRAWSRGGPVRGDPATVAVAAPAPAYPSVDDELATGG